MKSNKIISIFMAAVLWAAAPAAVFAQSAGFSASQSAPRELVISDEAGLVQLAQDCRLDSYSKNLYVTLAADISLSGEFTPVPVFGGTFDGGGHTISGAEITADGSYCGLFRYVQKGAFVKNLTVSGTVSPSGSGEYVGGIAGSNSGSIINCRFDGSVKGTSYVGAIAGINEKSGLITRCESTGDITGEHFSGGIAGSSSGTILSSVNNCSVNTTPSDAKLSIRDIDVGSIISQEELISKYDTGGIAGFSDGIIQGCRNYGTVGYQHIGYNVGGIVGRQSGYVSGCDNYGEILGRKDVGGIAGQMEPYRSIDFSKDTLQKLLDEQEILGGLIDNLIADAKTAGGAVDGSVQRLTQQMEQLRGCADDIADRTEDIYNGWTDGVNEITARADEALDGIAPALDV
ncbi:MAG: GLUG motif-containing protein, partial [Oscillospiraceae bacterium]